MLALAASLAAAAAVADDKPVPVPESPVRVVPPAPPAAPAAPAAAEDEDSVTEELIEILSQRGLPTKQEAESMIAKLRALAARRAAARAAAAAPPAAPAQATAAAGPKAGPPPAKAADDGTVRVIYLPESDMSQVREQVKNEVLETAKAENWAQPNALPAWLNRISLSGDLRFRYERDYFDPNNAPFISFQAINSGPPFDVGADNVSLPPFADTTQDREQPRMRARLGLNAKVDDDLSLGFRLTSGNNLNPVSTNQTLGTDFNKFSFVIDQAYFDYHPRPELSAWLGRMPKPWLSTNLLWWDDLSFDGVALQGRWPLLQGRLAPFLTAGAFSVENTDFNFPRTSIVKQASRDKWLYAAQLGTDWHVNSGLGGKLAVAYYYFSHLEGKLSAPCLTLAATDSCSTDDSRPGFVQGGNTLFAIRDTLPNPSSPNPDNGPFFQYFGLASPFRELDAVVQLDAALWGPHHLIFTGDYVDNLAFRQGRVNAAGPVNNIDANGKFHGGNIGFQMQLLAGYPELHERWQWNVLGGYKYLESDAVVDAFDDPDFRIGGTNEKGYFFIGSLGVLHDTWLSARWYSATEVTGPPLAVDVLQLDLNAGF